MLKKNRDLLSAVEQVTLKKIYHYYKRFKNKNIDCFHVAFSGGKDSIVLLDLVKRALPRTEFKVLFGDTGMEFPDTYKVVDIIEKQCKEEGIEFESSGVGWHYTHFEILCNDAEVGIIDNFLMEL